MQVTILGSHGEEWRTIFSRRGWPLGIVGAGKTPIRLAAGIVSGICKSLHEHGRLENFTTLSVLNHQGPMPALNNRVLRIWSGRCTGVVNGWTGLRLAMGSLASGTLCRL
jgi:hypothetical protein